MSAWAADTPPERKNAAWLALVAFGLALLLRVPFLDLPFSAADEGFYAATAKETIAGKRLYADLDYIRPPLLNVPYAAAYRLSRSAAIPWDLALRSFAAVASAMVVGALTYAVLCGFGLLPGLIGAAFALLLSSSLTLQNEANSETWMLLPYSLSALLVLAVARREHPKKHDPLLMVAAGILTGLAVGFKEVALVNLALPLVAWASSRRRDWRRWAVHTGVFVTGVALAATAVLLTVAITDDALAALYHTWFTRFDYAGDSAMRSVDAMQVLRIRFQALRGALLLPAVFGAGALAAASLVGRRQPAFRAALYAAGWALVSFIAVASTGRYYEHYFIQVTVPIALLIATSVAVLFAAFPTRSFKRVVVLAATALALLPVAFIAFLEYSNTEAYAGTVRFKAQEVAGTVDTLVGHGGTYLLWGTTASIRAYSSATAFTDVVWVYYRLGPAGGHRLMGRHFKGPGDRVLEDLERARPDVIVLTAKLGDRYLVDRPGSWLDLADDPRLEERLLAIIDAEYEVWEAAQEYVILRRIRSDPDFDS